MVDLKSLIGSGESPGDREGRSEAMCEVVFVYKRLQLTDKSWDEAHNNNLVIYIYIYM